MAWRIPEADLERVKRATDLRALVQSRSIELKRHGSKDWIERCPFHPDHETSNFIVTPDKGPGDALAQQLRRAVQLCAFARRTAADADQPLEARVAAVDLLG